MNAIVTGASSGIGKETAIELIKAGYKVHAAARRLEAMKDLEEQGASVHQTDLLNAQDITCLVEKVLARDGHIDLLVNNAGYGSYGAVEDVPIEEARRQFEINVFAPAILIQKILPSMRAQRSGRIINVSSIGGKIWSPMGTWYHSSKFALEGLSDTLRNELRPFGIHVVVVEPGGVKTDWGKIAMENMLKTSGGGAYQAAANHFSTMMKQMEESGAVERIFAKPEAIAKLIAKAAMDSNPKPRYVPPGAPRLILFLRWILSDRAFDWVSTRMYRLPKSA